MGYNTLGEVTFVNHIAANLLGYQPQALVSQPLKPLLYLADEGTEACRDVECALLGEPLNTACPSDCSKLNCLLYETLIAGKSFASEEAVLLSKDGQKVVVTLISSPIYNENKLTDGVLVFRDLALKELRQSASTI